VVYAIGNPGASVIVLVVHTLRHGQRHRRHRALSLVLTSTVVALSGWTMALPVEENTAIRRVVEQQLEAFAVDDAVTAFALTTPAMHQRFGVAERFVELVRQEYAVVYRPAAVKYFAADEVGGKVYQPVELRDDRGDYWLAMYEMQRQRDGGWRINGSVLTKSQAR
jgi:Domain of unknown function (DUF4864)